MQTTQKIYKHLLCEVPVSSASASKIQLPDLQTLKGRSIMAVEVYHIDEVSIAPMTTNPLVSDTVFKKSFLTLVTCDGKEEFDKCPLNSLRAKSNDGKIKNVGGQLFDYSKSYVSIAETTGLTASTSFLFSFYYE